MRKKTRDMLIGLKRALGVNFKQKSSIIYSQQISYVLLYLQFIEKTKHQGKVSCEKIRKICKSYFSIDNFDLTENEVALISNTLMKLDFLEDSLFEDIYEIFTDHTYKQKCGQFFTPENVSEMMVDMVIKGNEKVILDTASGMGTFLIAAGNKIHDIKHTLLIGFEKDTVLANISDIRLKYRFGKQNYVVCRDALEKHGYEIHPDVILSNPPYGTIINGELSEIAFIKENMKILKENGIMAIILPDGIYGNTKTTNLRDWLLNTGKILAIIDLPVETFMPYTNVKTSMMLIQKGKFERNYNIFMAISENCGHDKRGRTIPGCDFGQIALSYKEWLKNN